MRTSVIAYDLNKAILIFLVIITFIFVAGALYVLVDVLPGKSIPLLSGLVAGMILLTAILTWQPKVALPLLIVSVFFSPDIVMAQIPGREVNLRIEDGILVAALLGLFIRYAAGRERITIRTPLDLPILAFCAAGFISTAIGIYFGDLSPIRGFFFFAKRIEFFVLFYLLCHLLEEEREIKVAIYLVIACALCISVWGIYMRQTRPEELPWYGYNPVRASDAPSEMAEMMALAVPIIIAIAAETKSASNISLAAVTAPLIVYKLLDSGRRSAAIGAGVALVFLAVYRYRFLLIVLSGSVLYCIYRLPPLIKNRLIFIWVEIADYPQEGGSLPLRIEGITRAQGELLSPQRLLVGRGLGTHQLADAVSHSQYAQFSSEMGIIGLGIFFWLIFSIGRICWRGIKGAEDSLYRGYCVGYLAGLLGWLVMNLATIAFTCISTMEFFMLMTAILVAVVNKGVPKRVVE